MYHGYCRRHQCTGWLGHHTLLPSSHCGTSTFLSCTAHFHCIALGRTLWTDNKNHITTNGKSFQKEAQDPSMKFTFFTHSLHRGMLLFVLPKPNLLYGWYPVVNCILRWVFKTNSALKLDYLLALCLWYLFSLTKLIVFLYSDFTMYWCLLSRASQTLDCLSLSLTCCQTFLDTVSAVDFSGTQITPLFFPELTLSFMGFSYFAQSPECHIETISLI